MLLNLCSLLSPILLEKKIITHTNRKYFHFRLLQKCLRFLQLLLHQPNKFGKTNFILFFKIVSIFKNKFPVIFLLMILANEMVSVKYFCCCHHFKVMKTLQIVQLYRRFAFTQFYKFLVVFPSKFSLRHAK